MTGGENSVEAVFQGESQREGGAKEEIKAGNRLRKDRLYAEMVLRGCEDILVPCIFLFQ